MTPDVLLIGHIAKDITDDGWRPGGSVLYAAAQCEKLGLKTACVTSWAEDIDPAGLVPGAEWLVKPSAASTTFENRYQDGVRTQRLLDRAGQLSIEDVPDAWQGAPMVLLMPVFHDVDPGMVSSFACSATLLALTVQGWLRELDITIVGQPQSTPSGREWQGADIVFVSEEDLADAEAVEHWARYVPNVVLTRGRQGNTVWSEGVRADLPAFSSLEVDPTGAGDIYAAAFTVRLHETGDVVQSARFASAASALAVGGLGIEAVPERPAIEALMAREAIRSR